MSAGNDNQQSLEQGLTVLVVLLRFHGIGADPKQISHQFGTVSVGVDKAVVLSPLEQRPTLMTRAELEEVWTGQLVLVAKRATLSDLAQRFDVTWFLDAIQKYRRLLGEVLVASFFLQLFALVSPLFFQVVIDKVLVHHSMSTLDVLMIGLVAISTFELILG